MEKAIRLSRGYAHELGKVLFLALLIGFLGKISVFMPMNPIPLAFRPQLVILIAWIMGSKRTCFASSRVFGRSYIRFKIEGKGGRGYCELFIIIVPIRFTRGSRLSAIPWNSTRVFFRIFPLHLG